MEKDSHIQDRFYRRFSSGVRAVKIHLANFKYNHKDDYDNRDVYIDREILENKLLNWLISAEKSGSYLVSGYRGMGKSSLVSHVVDRITRQYNHGIERMYRISLVACFLMLVFVICERYFLASAAGFLFVILAQIVFINYYVYAFEFEDMAANIPNASYFGRTKIRKFLASRNRKRKHYDRIKVKVNLGREIMNERDVLCLITNNIRTYYDEFLRTGQNKPLWMYSWFMVSIMLTFLLYRLCIIPLGVMIAGIADMGHESWIIQILSRAVVVAQGVKFYPVPMVLCRTLCVGLCFVLVRRICAWMLSLFDKSAYCLKSLQNLSERLSSVIREGGDQFPVLSGGFLNISFFGHRQKESQVANVRDIETELIDIINTLNSKQCLKCLRVQFIIVLDELDKVDSASDENDDKGLNGERLASDLVPPDFMSVINGFSNSATNSERRKTILQLLASMKLFLTSARAKFIFISGRELYEAFLADLSDREYAISSIFSGVINVSSFLQPQREQSDISSMTEQYVSEILLPRNYLRDMANRNAKNNKVLKREIPSLRWYMQYLTEMAEEEFRGRDKELSYRKTEIRHVIMFLHCFVVYLSHVSNGSPKKIVLYFEKYVRRRENCQPLTEWDDVLEYGIPKDYVLYFTPQSQHKIGFVSRLTAPIMDVIINNVSNYDDKLLTSASFLLDHIFKFHGRGFSWRNIEQTPELLDVNKTSELRDFITSIIEYMQQIHITPIMVGLFQFKFRKRISEEISYISRISDEAAAIFNFTLNETHVIKQYNFMLLNYYMALSKNAGDAGQRRIYDDIIAHAHLTIADLYFQDEDYTRAIQEYRSTLNYLDRIRKADNKESTSSIILRISCMLKLGLACEYCKTYETAYLVYCSLVDEMITVREVVESELGLDLIDRRTDDWRIKQPMIVDVGVRQKDDASRKSALCNIEDKKLEQYRVQVINGLWDDGVETDIKDAKEDGCCKEKPYYAPAEYSLDFDQLVSGFSKNLSPQKSSIITKLTMFEDVRLVYKAILAKLFILEKMNMNGITMANIEVAEAEFKYLHRTTNVDEKFFVSADFFNQLGKILYYKNSLSLLPKPQKGKDGDDQDSGVFEVLYTALYWYDIDLLAYLDDFCFKVCRRGKYMSDRNANDAVRIKDDIRRFMRSVLIYGKGNIISGLSGSSRLKWSAWVKKIRDQNNEYQYYHDEHMLNKARKITDEYISYVVEYHSGASSRFLDAVIRCSDYRCSESAKVCHLPCYACRYYRRSLKILIGGMFSPQSFDKMRRKYMQDHMEIVLVSLSFGEHLHYTRVNHLRLLAIGAMSMGDVMLSCVAERRMTPGVLEIVRDILDDHLFRQADSDGCDRDRLKEDRTKELCEFASGLTKIDRAILYYLAAFRFFKIAQQPKDAVDCLYRILRVIDEVVTIVNFNKKSGDKYDEDTQNILSCREILVGDMDKDGNNGEKRNLMEVVFSRIVKLVNAQYSYSSISELHNYKWMFHMNISEDLDLTRLQTYSELMEPIWLITDTRIKLLNMLYYSSKQIPAFMLESKKIKEMQKSEIKQAYGLFHPVGHINDTFYTQITSYYARFRLNKWILKDMLGRDPLVNGTNSHYYNANFILKFVNSLSDYLSMSLPDDSLSKEIFEIGDNPEDKLQLIEFILEDSIVCLTEIIYILTPYNHISSFSNSFVAGVYEQLWEWAQMYESLVMVYDYRHYKDKIDLDEVFNTYKRAMLERNDKLMDAIRHCSDFIKDDSNLREHYGTLSSRFFMRLRHQIDDKMLQHVISNYAAEMALRYYAIAESSHSEGNAYRNQVSRNYILNDDLDNDTWLFNTALERFRLHSEYIQLHRRRMVRLYHDSRLYSYDSYVNGREQEQGMAEFFDGLRFEDSLNTNTELQ